MVPGIAEVAKVQENTDDIINFEVRRDLDEQQNHTA